MKSLQFESPRLETDRLILRPVEERDIPTVQYEFGRWSIIQYMTQSVPWPYPSNGAQFWFTENVLKRYADKTEAIWAITLKSRPAFLIGVISIREDTGDGNRGFWMAESQQGKGYMTEAVTAVNDWVFQYSELLELIVKNVSTNVASRRVKEKTGATRIRTIVEDYNNGESESEVWRIRKEDWLRFRSQ